MWIKYVMLIIWGLGSGAATACGIFAVLSVIGLLPIMAYKTRTAFFIKKYQYILALGIVAGCFVFLFQPRVRVPDAFMGIMGLAMGCFVGCFLSALAETLNAFPVVFRRFKIKTGLGFILIVFALSKTAGNLFFFFFYEK